MGVNTTAMALTEKPTVAPVKRSSRCSSNVTVKRTHEWLLSDVPSDITVEAGGTTFNLHKFPLVARSGRILRMVKEAVAPATATAATAAAAEKDIRLDLSDMPGGAEAFEAAAKFCYGVSLDISPSNVALLRCAAAYLDMTDAYAGGGSLETRTEAFLTEIALHSLPSAVTVLASCDKDTDSLLPFAEDLRITTRCIDAIAAAACAHQLSAGLSRLGGSGGAPPAPSATADDTASAWGRELTALNVHMFQRVVTAMRARGVGSEVLAGALMHYARGRLHSHSRGHGPSPRPRPRAHAPGPGLMSPLEREQRAIAETVASLLPSSAAAVPVGFLTWLLRESLALGVAATCRAELERRIAAQLDRATLDDLLAFDADVALRIFAAFLPPPPLPSESSPDSSDSDGDSAGESSGLPAAAKLLDAYLAEVAADPGLPVGKFVALAEALPETSRSGSDGVYRAVDIYLKAHPGIKDAERNRLCRLIDCRKLSPEASAHAAQNDRLPVQLAVQVLYFEQLRLRSAMIGSAAPDGPTAGVSTAAHGGGAGGGASAAISPRDNYASVRRENRELKLEVARMRMRLSDLERDHVSMRQELVKSTSARSRILTTLSRKLGRFHFLFRSRGGAGAKDPGLHVGAPGGHVSSAHILSRRRRHSIS